MTAELSSDAANTVSAKGLDRRSLIKAGAWAAPALVMTVAAPAASASPGDVPTSELTASSYTVSNLNADGTPGPLSWAGGQIGWYSAPPSGEPTIATVSYTVVLSGPGGLSVALVPAGVANIPRYGAHDFSAVTWGTKPLASGNYTVTVTAVGTDGTVSAVSNTVTVASTVTASNPTLTGVTGNKHRIDFTLTGPVGARVDIAATPTAAQLNPAFPASVTIPASGTIAVTATANATGQTPGSVNIGLSAATGWIVNPTSFGPITIPVKS